MAPSPAPPPIKPSPSLVVPPGMGSGMGFMPVVPPSPATDGPPNQVRSQPRGRKPVRGCRLSPNAPNALVGVPCAVKAIVGHNRMLRTLLHCPCCGHASIISRSGSADVVVTPYGICGFGMLLQRCRGYRGPVSSLSGI